MRTKTYLISFFISCFSMATMFAIFLKFFLTNTLDQEMSNDYVVFLINAGFGFGILGLISLIVMIQASKWWDEL